MIDYPPQLHNPTNPGGQGTPDCHLLSIRKRNFCFLSSYSSVFYHSNCRNEWNLVPKSPGNDDAVHVWRIYLDRILIGDILDTTSLSGVFWDKPGLASS